MANILFYTSPARGHLFPVLGAATALRDRGHNIHIRTISGEVERVRSLGLSCEQIAPRVEAREMDDWKATSPIRAVELAMKTFADRSGAEIEDLQTAIGKSEADLLVIDTNSWGAQATAEASGLPWALFQPYFTFLPAPGVPPFGPGFKRRNGIPGRLRDKLVGGVLFSKLNKFTLPAINSNRKRLGLDSFDSLLQMLERPHSILYYTTKALDYPRESWPENFRFVGPGLWSAQSERPDWLDKIDRPVALVTCSTERQKDRTIVEAGLKCIPELGFFVVATSASYDPGELQTKNDGNIRLERFIPHEPVVRRAGVVICHGGMGITQRALSHGVPVVVIPFGRDQLEVARRVEYAGAGVRLMPNRLNRKTLAGAVRKALERREGAERISRSMAEFGGDRTAADALEELLKSGLKASIA